MKSIFPSQGMGRHASRPEDILLICFYDPAGISTVPETVAFMQSASAFSITVINLFEHRQDTGYLKLSPQLDLSRFSALVIHNTVSYNVDNLRSLDIGLTKKLKDYPGVKVLMKQDENFRFRELARYIGETGFDLILTCLPPDAIAKVYPAELAGIPRFERMLTGYVTPTLRSMVFDSDVRPIDIGYRGSIQPLSFGRLAYEKQTIGSDVEALLADSGLVLDISSRWEDRFGGDSWFEFLRSCKATLGVESGASIFDLRGDLDARCAALEKRLGSRKDGREYAEGYLAHLSDIEDNVHYHQISPRHFEAIATGTVQLLYPGKYSGILTADRHYFPLRRDHSNIQDGVDLIRDRERRESMVRLAFTEVILNPENWIEAFVSRLDAVVGELLAAKNMAFEPSVRGLRKAKNVLLIAAHKPKLDPRLGWIEECAGDELCIHQLGVLPPDAVAADSDVSAREGLILAWPRVAWVKGNCDLLFGRVTSSPAGMAGVQELHFIERALELSNDGFCALFGAPPGAERNAQFRWYLQYFLDTAATLLNPALRMRGVHAIIATDLDTLAVALVLKGIFEIPVFYDAHEYWPEADLASFEYEKQFWVGMEKRLSAHVDYRQTVSAGLAELMSEQYGVQFVNVPNCEPAERILRVASHRPRKDGTCHLLYQGGFARGRGIDLLIQAWAETDPRAILLLRGPDNPYKSEMVQLAKKTRLLESRIFFLKAVDEAALISAASEADVGLIPYTPSGMTYRHCCPNKLSQYMAAGLPILANSTDFVASVIRAAGCGYVVNFNRRGELVQAVARLVNDTELCTRLGQAGQGHFVDRFNWQSVSQPLYGGLLTMIRGKQPETLRLFDRFRAFELSPVRAPSSFEPVMLSSTSEPARRRNAVLLRSVWRSLPKGMQSGLMPVARRLRAWVR